MHRTLFVAVLLSFAALFAFPSIASAAPTDDARAAHGARTVSGGSLRVEPGETVGDVTVMNGSVDVFGTVDGDLLVVGGSARVHPDAAVLGDARAVGGSLVLDEGARVDGDVGVVGGVLRRASETASSDEPARVKAHRHHAGSSLLGVARHVSSAIVRACLFFALGVVFLALGGARMETMRVEMATRPGRGFAVGLLAFLAASVTSLALCITIIGIPFAVLGALALGLVAAFGTTAALTTVGEILFLHRSRNAYLHLALGCVLFLVVGLVPVVGHLVQLGVILTGAGLFLGTLRARASGADRPAVAL